MINSFSSRYLILGDFNGHSHLWGAKQENERGKVVEKLIERHNLTLLNESVHTRLDTYHQTSSLLDLSLCHPSMYMDVTCEVSSDRLGISRKQNEMPFKINVLLKKLLIYSMMPRIGWPYSPVHYLI